MFNHLEADMFGRRFHRKPYRRKTFFPFWIFFVILFFGFAGKSGIWAFMLPFFLIWMLGSMAWGLSSGARQWEDQRKWKQARLEPRDIPTQWQTPPQSRPAPHQAPTKVPTVGQPLRSMAGLPTTCAACGGPVNATTVEWRAGNPPHCGYCGTNLK